MPALSRDRDADGGSWSPPPWLVPPATPRARLPRGMRIRDLEEAGLYDRHAPDAAARRELLVYLACHGASVQEMVEADRGGRLAALVLDRAINPDGRRLTALAAAKRARVSPEDAARARRAVGLTEPEDDAPHFHDGDVEMLEIFDEAREILGEAVALQLARVIGTSVVRIAEAEVVAFVHNIAAPLVSPDAPDLAIARANEAVAAVMPRVARLVELLHREHIEAALRRFAVPRNALDDGDRLRMAVGFADLVGFTALTQQLAIEELEEMIVAFESQAAEIVHGHGGRLVKQIGDEVMFVAGSAVDGVAVTVALLEHFDGSGALPAVRCGLAAGEVLARDGDYYGPTVNLASRAVKLSEPGRGLATDGVVEEVPDLPESWRWGRGRARRVRGFDGRTVLHPLAPVGSRAHLSQGLPRVLRLARL